MNILENKKRSNSVVCRQWTCNWKRNGQAQLCVESGLTNRREKGQIQLHVEGGLTTERKKGRAVVAS